MHFSTLSSCRLPTAFARSVRVIWIHIWRVSFVEQSRQWLSLLMMMSIEIPFDSLCSLFALSLPPSLCHIYLFFPKSILKVMTNCSDNCNAPTINILYTHLRRFDDRHVYWWFSLRLILCLNLNVKIGLVCLLKYVVLRASIQLICPSVWHFPSLCVAHTHTQFLNLHVRRELLFVLQLVSAASHFSFLNFTYFPTMMNYGKL